MGRAFLILKLVWWLVRMYVKESDFHLIEIGHWRAADKTLKGVYGWVRYHGSKEVTHFPSTEREAIWSTKLTDQRYITA